MVELGIKVKMMEVALVLEDPFVGGAEVVHVTVVFLELCIASKNCS